MSSPPPPSTHLGASGPPPVPPPPPPPPAGRPSATSRATAASTASAVSSASSAPSILPRLSTLGEDGVDGLPGDSDSFWARLGDMAREGADAGRAALAHCRFLQDPAGGGGAGWPQYRAYLGHAGRRCAEEFGEAADERAARRAEAEGMADAIESFSGIRRRLDEALGAAAREWEGEARKLDAIRAKQSQYDTMEADYLNDVRAYLAMKHASEEAALLAKRRELDTKAQFLELTRFDLETQLTQYHRQHASAAVRAAAATAKAYEEAYRAGAEALAARGGGGGGGGGSTPEAALARAEAERAEADEYAQHRRRLRRQVEKRLFAKNKEVKQVTQSDGHGVRDLADGRGAAPPASSDRSGYLYLPPGASVGFARVWCRIADGTLRVTTPMPRHGAGDLDLSVPPSAEALAPPAAEPNPPGSPGAGARAAGRRGTVQRASGRRASSLYYNQSVPLLLCTVKEARDSQYRFVFNVISPQKTLTLQAESQEDMSAWMAAIQAAIAALLNAEQSPASKKLTDEERALAEENVAALRAVPGNDRCADCGQASPEWVSISLGVLVCLDCSGAHRSLGTHISKVRSATLDKLDPFLMETLMALGNERVNALHEGRLPDAATKPGEASSRAEKAAYVRDKYASRLFMAELQPRVPPEGLNDALYAALGEGDYPRLLHILLSGANADWNNPAEEDRTPLIQAVFLGAQPATEILVQNGANMRATESRGWTALHYGAYYGDEASVEQLLLHGARALVTLPDLDGWTPVDLAQSCHDTAVADAAAAGEEAPPVPRYLSLLTEAAEEARRKDEERRRQDAARAAEMGADEAGGGGAAAGADGGAAGGAAGAGGGFMSPGRKRQPSVPQSRTKKMWAGFKKKLGK